MKPYPSISTILANAWHKYESSIIRSRKILSVENVHQLRVANQKLEAALSLSNVLTKNTKTKRHLKRLKKTRSSCGPLRDMQVELQELAELHFASKDTKDYFQFCKTQKREAEKKALRAIQRKFPNRLLRFLEKEKSKLKQIEGMKSRAEIKILLEENLKNHFFPLDKILRNHSISKKSGLHKYRILTKQLRYQGEAMKLAVGSSMLDINRLKGAQDELGRIQDNNTMIKNLNYYLENRKNKDQPGLIAIRDQIQLSHEKLVQLELQALSKQKWKNSV